MGIGSSPPVWGKLPGIDHQGTHCRIIPTRVGKTPEFFTPKGFNADHPHPCGENNPTSLATCSVVGSSPPVWGKRKRFRRFRMEIRIIPTRVGKTCRPVSVLPHCSDHPHPCGENACDKTLQDGGVGSSPPVWGKRWRFLIGEGVRRIIPTRVGKTPVKCIPVLRWPQYLVVGDRLCQWKRKFEGQDFPVDL